MKYRAVVASILVASTGCLASKSDIRLLQDELRATRSQLGIVDTSIIRTNEQRRQQIATLSANIDRMNDSLRVLAARFASFQATANGEFDAIGRQIVTMNSLLGQTTRNVQDARAQLEALKEQANTGMTAPVPAGDPNKAPPAGVPGPGTLFTTGREQLDNGANNTARTAFEQLISAWPNSPEAPRAQLYIGVSYANDRNMAAADSVYQLVFTKYPKSPEAPNALYKHGIFLWDANKKAEARQALNRVVNDYPNSDEARNARDFLRDRAGDR
jgi:tol-pal system protein YbgF